MSQILRIGSAIGLDELLVLSRISNRSRTVIGNLGQFGARDMSGIRKVSADRLLNMGLAAAQMSEYSNAIVSGEPNVANTIFGNRRTKATEKSFLIRETEPDKIKSLLSELDLSLIDTVLTTSLRSKRTAERALNSDTNVILVENWGDHYGVELASEHTNSEPKSAGMLRWFGASSKGLGLQDFLRTVSLLDGEISLSWSRIPTPDEFTRFFSTASSFGLMDRIRMSRVTTVDDLIEEVPRFSDVWFYTPREYSEEAGIESLLHCGAKVVAFDSLHAIELKERYPSQVALVPEGDYEEAALAAKNLRV